MRFLFSAKQAPNTATQRVLRGVGGLLSVLWVTTLVVACSGDKVNNSVKIGGSGSSRAIQTEVVNQDQADFRRTLYTPILGDTTKCGACHYNGGQVASSGLWFSDDVSIAYAIAFNNTTLFNRTTPASSQVVTQVAGGHNCWSASCSNDAAEIAAAITAWQAAIDGAGNGGGGTPSPVAVVELVDQLSAPTVNVPPTPTQTFPASGTDAYTTLRNTYSGASNLHNLLTTYCSGCHVTTSATPQRPYFAVADAEESMNTLVQNQKIDITNPLNSRIYLRLNQDAHNCWTNCAENAPEMLSAINRFIDAFPAVSSTVPAQWVASQALKLTEAVPVSAGVVRYEPSSRLTALYKFDDAQTQRIARDSSGNGIDLSLGRDVQWVSGWGLEFDGTKPQSNAVANSGDSSLVWDAITESGEYSIEAWVVANNVMASDQPRVIAGMSVGDNVNTFSLGQMQYNVVFSHRITTNQATGDAERLQSDDGDEVLQATQQHVVVTYKRGSPRKIYVDGALVKQDTIVPGTNFDNWFGPASSYPFVIGAESDGSNGFQGKIRLLALFNEELSAEHVLQNFEAGVGQKFALMFKIGHMDDVDANNKGTMHDQTYVMLTAEEFDNFSYRLFNPRLAVLAQDPLISATTGNISMKSMRIGINGLEPETGQAYGRLNTTVTWSLTARPEATVPGSMRSLTNILSSTNHDFGSGSVAVPNKASGTVIAKQVNVTTDQFFIKFAELGGRTDVVVPGTVTVATPDYSTNTASSNDYALKTFDEVYATMVNLTGVNPNVGSVDPDTASIKELYFNVIRASLPTIADATTFVAAQQVSIARLGFEFCSALVDDSTKRAAMFPGFDFSGNMATAFEANNGAGKQIIAQALAEKFVGTNLTTPANMPNNAPTAQTVVDILITNLDANPNQNYSAENLYARLDTQCRATIPTPENPVVDCTSDARTIKVVKSMCMAALGSAATLLH